MLPAPRYTTASTPKQGPQNTLGTHSNTQVNCVFTGDLLSIRTIVYIYTRIGGVFVFIAVDPDSFTLSIRIVVDFMSTATTAAVDKLL